MWKIAVERGPAIAFWLLALAAQMSGYTNAAIALALMGGAAFFLIAPVYHYGTKWHNERKSRSMAGFDSLYFIVPTIAVGVIALAIGMFGLGLRSAKTPPGQLLPQEISYLKDPFIYAGSDNPALNPRFVAKFARAGPRARFYVEDRYYPSGVFSGAPVLIEGTQLLLREYKDFVANDPIEFPILTPFDFEGRKLWRWGSSATDKPDPKTTFQAGATHQGRIVLVVDNSTPQYFYFIIDPAAMDAPPHLVGQWRFDFIQQWVAEDAQQK